MGSQQNADYYDEIYQNSPSYTGTYKLTGYVPIWATAAFWINRGILGKPLMHHHVLDLGCGTGQFPECLRDLFAFEEERLSYTGIDFSPQAIQIAKKRRLPNENYQFLCMDLFDPTVKIFCERHNIATVTLFEVLEHIHDDIRLLETIPPGTAIIFSVPSFDDPGHVRKFENSKEVEDRYSKAIDLKFIIPFGSWFIGYGHTK